MIIDVEELTLNTSQSLSANFFSPAIEIYGFDCGSIVFVWTGADATNATITPQVSNDKITWCDYFAVADSRRLDAAAGDQMYEIQKCCFKYLRVKFIANSNTAGSMTITTFFKRHPRWR